VSCVFMQPPESVGVVKVGDAELTDDSAIDGRLELSPHGEQSDMHQFQKILSAIPAIEILRNLNEFVSVCVCVCVHPYSTCGRALGRPYSAIDIRCKQLQFQSKGVGGLSWTW